MNFADGGSTVEWDNKQNQRNQTFHFLVILPVDFAGPNTKTGGSKVSCAGHITEYLATRTRRFPNSKTILICKVCGARIPSRNWSRRTPENKVLLCTRHLSSRNIYIRMKKKWPCMEDQ